MPENLQHCRGGAGNQPAECGLVPAGAAALRRRGAIKLSANSRLHSHKCMRQHGVRAWRLAPPLHMRARHIPSASQQQPRSNLTVCAPAPAAAVAANCRWEGLVPAGPLRACPPLVCTAHPPYTLSRAPHAHGTPAVQQADDLCVRGCWWQFPCVELMRPASGRVSINSHRCDLLARGTASTTTDGDGQNSLTHTHTQTAGAMDKAASHKERAR
eukprot:349588-Chlamydomonas_euryale.AAC.10